MYLLSPKLLNIKFYEYLAMAVYTGVHTCHFKLWQGNKIHLFTMQIFLFLSIYKKPHQEYY